MKISNWWIIVAIPGVWIAIYMVLGFINLLIVLLPLFLIGSIFYLFKKQTTIKP